MARKTKCLYEWCIEHQFDDIINEWDADRNNSRCPIYINRIEYNSPLSAYWKCNKGHEWSGPIVARTLFGRNCPVCNPEMAELPVGTTYGCLTIIGDFSVYRKEVAEKEIQKFEMNKTDYLNGIRKPGSNIDSVDYYDFWIREYQNRKLYQCQCKCGLTYYLDEFHFLESKHKYCPGECGIRTRQKEKLLDSYKRIYDKNYSVDFTHTFHESLEVMECIDDHYEVLTGYYDKRKKGGGEYTVYKLYRCKCYLCGKEQNIKSSEFYINPPTAYGYTAYNGYYSGAKCDCHQISSFQWKVNKLLKEHRIPYRVEESFPNLFGIGKKNLLRFDFAILNIDGTIKCLIECQGGQHNYPVEEFGGIKVFVAQQKNDELKRRFADEQGIPLYEISDKNKKYEAIEAFLKSHGVID